MSPNPPCELFISFYLIYVLQSRGLVQQTRTGVSSLPRAKQCSAVTSKMLLSIRCFASPIHLSPPGLVEHLWTLSTSDMMPIPAPYNVFTCVLAFTGGRGMVLTLGSGTEIGAPPPHATAPSVFLVGLPPCFEDPDSRTTADLRHSIWSNSKTNECHFAPVSCSFPVHSLVLSSTVNDRLCIFLASNVTPNTPHPPPKFPSSAHEPM